jgi:hypothetical protein
MPKIGPEAPSRSGKIAIFFVVDMSGSMWHIAEDTRGTINSFIGDQVGQEGEAFVSLTVFDTIVETPVKAVAAEDFPEITPDIYNPRGSTALLDAVGITIRSAEDVVGV